MKQKYKFFWNSLEFLEIFWNFYDPADVGNLISGSSVFSKSILYIWKFSVNVLFYFQWKTGDCSLLDGQRGKVVSDTIVEITAVVQLLSHLQLFATPWMVACQAPLSMGLPRQKYLSKFPFPYPGHLPNLLIKPVSPESVGKFFIAGPSGKPHRLQTACINKNICVPKKTENNQFTQINLFFLHITI